MRLQEGVEVRWHRQSPSHGWSVAQTEAETCIELRVDLRASRSSVAEVMFDVYNERQSRPKAPTHNLPPLQT